MISSFHREFDDGAYKYSAFEHQLDDQTISIYTRIIIRFLYGYQTYDLHLPILLRSIQHYLYLRGLHTNNEQKRIHRRDLAAPYTPALL